MRESRSGWKEDANRRVMRMTDIVIMIRNALMIGGVVLNDGEFKMF